jgi:AcrR family transcriptional regulator
MRAATMEEITTTARRLLVEQGPDAASLRAIAREMGMTAPGLYRYYSSREELLRHVVASMFRELAGDIRGAIEAADPKPASGFASDSSRRTHLAMKLVAACREFRRWALNHKDEFALLFGVPVPGLDDGRFDIAEQCALEFAGTFYVLFLAGSSGGSARSWAPMPLTARSWSSSGAGRCSTARYRWRSSVISGSRSTTRPRCSS